MRKPSSPAISIRSAVSASTRENSRFSMDCSEHMRLDVNQHVGHPINFRADLFPHLRGDFVRLVDAHGGIDFEMQIHVPLQTRLTGETFFDAEDAGDMETGYAD